MPPDNSKRPLVPCTCKHYDCGHLKYIGADGSELQGKPMPSSTRSYHRKKDLEDEAREAAQLITDQPNHDVISATQAPKSMAPVVQPNQNVASDHQGNSAEGEKEIEREKEVQSIFEGIGNENPAQHRRLIFTLTCVLAGWLHICCGISRATTSKVIRFTESLLVSAVRLGISLASSTVPATSLSSNPNIQLPHDARTAVSVLNIDPVIIRSICCPKCYAPYTLETLPQICCRRETIRSKPCQEELWVKRNGRGGPKTVPRRLYSTQCFDSWLEFFLSRKVIQDHINKSYDHKPSSTKMHSIQDSPAWRSLGSFTATRGNLTFAYYIDWFNPLTNKIAGKTMSCGAIMLFCLNLPEDLQNKPENVFFAGITPPPKEPTVTTITALADPIVDRLEKWYHGARVRTHYHPEGEHCRVAVLPAIGDLLAIRKALGFAGVAADQFCSFCYLQRINIDDLDVASWRARTGPDVRAAAEEWRRATTKKKRKELLKSNGVRWSSMHRLLYRDPVQHTILGVMHNWIEGVLQHHVRVKWGVGVKSFAAPQDSDRENELSTPPSTPRPGDAMEIDVEMLDEELRALHEESEMHKDHPSHLNRLRSEASILQLDPSAGMEMDVDEDYQPDEESDIDDDEIAEDTAWITGCIFDVTQLLAIRKCIGGAVVPSWLERPPRNLGEKAHGKLKADQWYSLISVFLPLILPELWISTQSRRDLDLLNNFHDLVSCTNIVCAYSTSSTLADEYLDRYINYRQSSSLLFPNVASRPNHHYAMHNAPLLKFWGPLIKLSEFGGERQNGSLQKINTNQHIWEMDFTMLRQICRRGRLNAIIADGAALMGEFGASLGILQGTKEQIRSLATRMRIPEAHYNLILAYLNANGNAYRHHTHLPHPLDTAVLAPSASQVNHITHKGRTYSTVDMHPGNSSLMYQSAGGLETGIIQAAWELQSSLNPTSRTILVVVPYQSLSVADRRKDPYASRSGFLCNLVYGKTEQRQTAAIKIIESIHIVSHLPFYDRPPGTFGIARATRILVNSLHRGRD